MKFVDSKSALTRRIPLSPRPPPPPPPFMLLTVLRRWSRCCSYSVWLCGIYYGALHVWSCLALCSPVFQPFSIAIISGKRELVYVLLVHLFVYSATLTFVLFLFLLVSGVGYGFRLWYSLEFAINFSPSTLGTNH